MIRKFTGMTPQLRLLMIIMIVGWGMRIGYVLWLQNRLESSGREFLIAGDAEGYWELAKAISRGADFAVHSPPRYVHRMPGFPMLLSVSILLFGESLFAARLLLATLGALTCGLVYLLGKRLHSAEVGVVAATLHAVSPAAIGFSGLVLSETAFTAALMLALLSAHALISLLQRWSAEMIESRVWRQWRSLLTRAIGTGMLIALGVYLKPSWILIGPMLGLGLWLSLQPRLVTGIAGGMVMLGMFLTLLPWGIRNQQVSGHFTLTTFWMGPSLYDGLNPQATGDSDMQFFDDDQLSRVLSEYEVDQEYRRRAFGFAFNHPQRVLELAVIKFWRYWKPWPNADQFGQLLVQIGLCLYTLPVYLLALAGVIHSRRQIWSVVICAAPIFYFSGLHLFFVSSLRYRLPAEAPFLVLSAIGAVSLLDQFRRSFITQTD